MSKALFECAVTGQTEEVEENPLNKDPLGGVPLGWYRITVERQVPNPKYVALAQLKASFLERSLASLPTAADRDAQQNAILLQLDAQFAALESITPAAGLERVVTYISPPENEAECGATLERLSELLNITLAFDTPEGAEDNEAEPAQPEQKPTPPKV